MDERQTKINSFYEVYEHLSRKWNLHCDTHESIYEGDDSWVKVYCDDGKLIAIVKRESMVDCFEKAQELLISWDERMMGLRYEKHYA